MTDYYWVNGKLSVDAPVLPLNYRGVLFGQSAFETMRSYHGHIRLLRSHIERLFHSIEALDIPNTLDVITLKTEIYGALRTMTYDNAVIRFYFIAGEAEPGLAGKWVSEPIRILHISPAPTISPNLRQSGVLCLSVNVDSLPVGPIQGAKTMSYAGNVVAYRRAVAAGAFEALLVNSSGELIDGATSSVIAVTGGHLVTTPIDSKRLPSITLEYVLQLAKSECNSVTRNTVTLDTLLAADEVLLVSTLKEVIASVKIDKYCIGSGTRGPLAQVLQNKYLNSFTG